MVLSGWLYECSAVQVAGIVLIEWNYWYDTVQFVLLMMS